MGDQSVITIINYFFKENFVITAGSYIVKYTFNTLKKKGKCFHSPTLFYIHLSLQKTISSEQMFIRKLKFTG